MIAQLLEPTTNSPVGDTDADSHTQRHDCPASAKRQSQRHADEGHHQDAEWIDVFALQRQRQGGDVNAALLGRFQIAP